MQDVLIPEVSIARTATVVWLLALGGKYKTSAIMRIANLSTRQGAYYLMSGIAAAAVPVAQVDGYWQIVTERDAEAYWAQERVVTSR